MKLPAGSKVLAQWREAGEWWSHEAPLEVVRYVDAQGIRREQVAELPGLIQSQAPPKPYEEDHREEIALRPRKVRDEKVAIACGYAPQTPDAMYQALRGGTKVQSYAALHVLSGYAFGRSTLFAEEIPRHAAEMGLAAVALADPFSMVGSIEFALEAKKCGVKPLIGASFELAEGGSIVLIARDKRGYVSLSQLITECHLSEPRLFPLANWDRLQRHARGLICLTGGDTGPVNRLLVRGESASAEALVLRLMAVYGQPNVAVEIERSYLPWERGVNAQLMELAQKHNLLAVAGGMVTHRRREDFPVQDILVCADTLCQVDEVIGRKPPRHPLQFDPGDRPVRALNAERIFADPAEMAARFSDAPELLANTLRLADRVDDDVLPARSQMPSLSGDDSRMLRELTLAGAQRLHGAKLNHKLKRRLDHELTRMIKLNFASHFVVAWDFCRWSQEQGIMLSGRGSVVDSAVAYCLGLSRIDAFAHNLHFDRFLPEDGSKRPDIDLDFEAKRRDDVRNYLVQKYGKDHVAGVAAVGAYSTRGIIREVGKALGLSQPVVDLLTKRVHGGVSPEKIESALLSRPELRESGVPSERFKWVFRFAGMMADLPRNMRAHSSGVVISAAPLSETVPLQWSAAGGDDEENLRIIQWDKRSAKHYFDKFDILCLRGQDVLSGTESRIRQSEPDFNSETLPLNDEESYRAMRSGELIGIPQSASPAMRQAHIRLRTANLHDASLVQAGIRPGVGGSVKINTLIARRRGLEPYEFEHPELERILGLTYGIVVFQEQIDQLLQAFCGYSSGEAEDIRDKIHKRRREDYGEVIREELIQRVVSRGFTTSIANHVFELVAAFKGYGFAQGHALAFADISIRSVICQQNYPAPYFASILSAQPAGYYGPCTLVNEARIRGVRILPPDVNLSGLDFEVEDVKECDLVVPSGGVRVALNQIDGLSKDLKKRLLQVRLEQSIQGMFDFVRRVNPARDELEKLILCGAFDRLNSNRRSLLWAIPEAYTYAASVRNATLPMVVPEPQLEPVNDFSHSEKVVHERRILGLDVEQHLMAWERETVSRKGGLTTLEAKNLPNRRKAIVVGNPIRLRFPPTPSGKRVVFFDLEDETGLLNVTCFDAVYQRDGHAIVCSPYVTLIGQAQDRDGHTAFLVKRAFPYRPRLLDSLGLNAKLPVGASDFLAR